MQKKHQAQHGRCHKRHAHEAVSDAAMVLQSGDRTAELPQHVDVGGLGGEHHGHGGQRDLRLKPERPRQRAGQEVSQWIQSLPQVELDCSKRAIVRRRAGCVQAGCS